MNYTTNYKLNKPERNEQYNLDDWNNNSDTIDSQMHTNAVDIATNAKNIATILAGINSRNTADTGSVFYRLMQLIYPVGSLYWSSKSTNPSELFGGSWVQIKDRFVLACGNTYATTGQTGGANSVTLTVNNMPSHSHSFTGSSHSGSAYFKNTDGKSDLISASGILSVSNSANGIGEGNHGKMGFANLNISFKTSGSIGNTGSGVPFSILPPYVIKYCWERIA